MGRRAKTKSLDRGVQNSLYFDEYSPQDFGHFVPLYLNFGQAAGDAGERVNETQRSQLVAYSRMFVANIPEISAAMQRLADFTVGNALIPLFNGEDQDWANNIKKNFLNKILGNLTRLGIAGDWQTTWQLVLKLVLTDGDLLLIPYKDRYGLPHVDFIEGHRISSRNSQDTVKGGRYDGYPCEDGVIYDRAGGVLGYQILGDIPADDYTISKENCFLLYSPFSFSKGRGIPILASAARHGRNLMDYQHFIPQIIKTEGQVQLVETNQDGKAPPGRTNVYNYVNKAVTLNGTSSVNALTEYTQAGIRYLKANGGKLESLKSTRPTQEVQSYITATQKEMLCPLFPHQLLLSPETIGGPGARGLKEILVASVNTHRTMIEKYALLTLQYVLSVALSNQSLQSSFGFKTNFKEDFTDWGFTKAPEIVLDAGYERSADIADLNAGLKSPAEIVAKEGKLYDDVLKDIAEAAGKKAEEILYFQQKYPTLAAYAPQMFGLQKEPFEQVPSSDQPPTK